MNLKAEQTEAAVLFISAVVVLILFWATFIAPYFPMSSGLMGHDHRGSLTDATIGYLHFHRGGLALPWFTPATCGGNMFIAGIANPYLNVQQWLTFFLDPLTASKINMLLFAGAGFFGTYLLLRRSFQLDQTAALLGAGLFVFNGFFAYRMIIGHTAFHSVMLVPLIAALLLQPAPQNRNLLIAALLVSYMFLASGINMLVPGIAGIFGILLLYSLKTGAPVSGLTLKLLLVLALTTLMCLFKITISLSTAANFSRDFYPLPGIPSLIDAITLPARLLFFSAPDWDIEGRYLFTNYLWRIDQHELEMGVGLPVLFLLIAGLVLKRDQIMQSMRKAPLAAGLLLTVLLAPILLNYYAEWWNALLKSLPVVGSFSLFVRFYVIYVPLAIVAGILAFSAVTRFRLVIASLIFVASAATPWFLDRNYYLNQDYDPTLIQSFYERYRNTPEKIPDVSHLSAIDYANFQGETIRIMNEMFIFGRSNLQCHNDTFGYRLEAFPKRELLDPAAPALSAGDAGFNFKNPACYVFPDANQCEPGDHFQLTEENNLRSFLAYEPLAFNFPAFQKISNLLSLLSILGVFIGIGISLRPGATTRVSEKK